jgi:ribosome-binding factor A
LKQQLKGVYFMSRLDRLSSLLKRELADILRKEILDSPGLGLVSIMGVDISKDLALAKVYYSHMGSDSSRNKVRDKLRKASRYIKGLVGRRIKIATIPDLLFVYDDSLKKGVELVNRINEITEQG